MKAIMVIVGLFCLAVFNAAFAGQSAQKPENPNCEPKPPLESRLQLAPGLSSEYELTSIPQGQEQYASSSDGQEVPSVSYTSFNECGTEEKQ